MKPGRCDGSRCRRRNLFGEGFEILDGFGRDVRPEGEDDFAVGGFDDGDFVGFHIGNYLMELAGTILMLMMPMRLSGRSVG